MCNLCTNVTSPITLIDLYPELTTIDRYVKAKIIELDLDSNESYNDGYNDGGGEARQEWEDEQVRFYDQAKLARDYLISGDLNKLKAELDIIIGDIG